VQTRAMDIHRNLDGVKSSPALQPHNDFAPALVPNGDSSKTTSNQALRDPLAGPSRPTDLRSTQRKPTPSSLQSSQTSTLSKPEGSHASSVRTRQYPSSSTPANQQRSPFQSLSAEDQSPKDRLDALLATEGSLYSTAGSGADLHSVDAAGSRKGSLTSPKITSYGQLRNASSPIPIPQSQGDSLSLTSTMITNSMGTQRPDPHPMPRTSSIDSAISSISSTTSHTYKPPQDPVAADGSQDANLLKEKQHFAAQNAQLWRLVDKQRSLVIGLNKDLERALKDKERYRKKLKEHLAQVPPVPSTAAPNVSEPPRNNSESPAPSDVLDEPNQANNVRHIITGATVGIHDILERTPLAHESHLIQHPSDRPIAIEPSATAATDIEMEPQDHPKRPEPETPPSQQGVKALAPLVARTQVPETMGSAQFASQTSPLMESKVSPTSFTAKRSLPLLQKPPDYPSLAITEASPLAEKANKSPPLLRKPPPAPLNLNHFDRPSPHLHQLSAEEHSGSEYDDILEVDEIPAFERGRRKTREEDDRDREAAALKAQESRSVSKKNKGGALDKPKPEKTEPAQPTLEVPAPQPAKQMVPQSPPESMAGFLSPPGSLAAALSIPSSEASLSIQQRILSAPPMSPGLPLSPRPGDRPINSPLPRMPRGGANLNLASPPMSPRGGFPGLPLSPRQPKQLIPYPPNTPVSMISLEPLKTEPYRSWSPTTSVHSGESRNRLPPEMSEPRNAPTPEPSITSTVNPICRDLVSEDHPDLLLPPNALPSIEIKVCSSRLRPSRNSYVVSKNPEEGQCFTLGVYARSGGRELWRVEKILMALPQLDHQLKQCSTFNARLPDRALFSGHAPARIDARSIALNRYFEIMLNTPLTERAAFVVCSFLSTDAMDSQSEETSTIGDPVQGKVTTTGSMEGRTRKQGYLTKRGKNFGGWKARFFVLDGPVLRYYESPGGPHLGTIKLLAAQIGKQSHQQSNQSPSRSGDDVDNQYRHAFLILEPKRKDSNSHVRHVLCAESDFERDEWVEALLQYVDYQSSGDERPSVLPRHGSSVGKKSSAQVRGLVRKDSSNANSPVFENSEALHSLSYEHTVAADAPVLGSTSTGRHLETPSPPMTSTQLGPGIGSTDSQSLKSISGPTNGGPIQDAGAWGNKPLAANRAAKEKEHKKRSFWGFKARSSTDLAVQAQSDSTSISSARPRPIERTGSTRPAFGATLADAVENCPPIDVDVHLPAVVYRCIEYLDAKDAASEEGIFRLSGSNVLIKQLRERFNIEGDVDFLAEDHYYDVHAVASLLKLYLRELPTTVLTRELHLDFLQVLGE
jgi:RalA-binding protein 1